MGIIWYKKKVNLGSWSQLWLENIECRWQCAMLIVVWSNWYVLRRYLHVAENRNAWDSADFAHCRILMYSGKFCMHSDYGMFSVLASLRTLVIRDVRPSPFLSNRKQLSPNVAPSPLPSTLLPSLPFPLFPFPKNPTRGTDMWKAVSSPGPGVEARPRTLSHGNILVAYVQCKWVCFVKWKKFFQFFQEASCFHLSME